MARQMLFTTVVLCLGLLSACASNPYSRYSQAQLNAIEMREVDANLDQTFSAASNALFDAGYTIAMSDRAGGLVTGERKDDKTTERIWISPYIQDTEFRLSIQVRELEPNRCAVRVKASRNGEPIVDKGAVDQIWTLMQRQVLMKEPASLEQSQASSSESR